METKNTSIQVSKGLWLVLNAMKDQGESFEDVILKLVSLKKRNESLNITQN